METKYSSYVGQTFASLLQIIGAAAFTVLAVLAFAYHSWACMGWATLAAAFHIYGDTVTRFIQIPDNSALMLALGQFLKVRPFLAFVGLFLMNIGENHRGINVTVRFWRHTWHVLTSHGVHTFGFALALIGVLIYSVIYNSEDRLLPSNG